MRKALYMLGDLAEEDILFLARAGDVGGYDIGDVLIHSGKRPDALHIVTHGSFAVRLPDGRTVATLEVGDVVGEMSFVEDRLPETDVIALEPSRALAVPRAALDAELAAQPAFAGRFYKALATFLSDRLRSLTAERQGGLSSGEVLDERLLDIVHVAGDRMLRLIAILEGRETA